MKKELQLKVKALRKRGFSIKEIKKLVDASKSSISLWARNVKMSHKASKRLASRYTYGQLMSQAAIRKKSEAKMGFAREYATKVVSGIKLNKDMSAVLCSMLYWCEGDKDPNYTIGFTNSDPSLMKTFLFLFRNAHNLDESKFRVTMQLHSYHNERRQKLFWSGVTGISPEKFNKSYLKSSNHKYKKEGYQGCIRVSYYDNQLGRKLASIAKIFMERYN